LSEHAKQLKGAGIVRIAAGVVLGWAVIEAIDAFIRVLFAPLISVFIGNNYFELNSFTIDGSEFRYGTFLIGILVVATAWLLVSVAVPILWRRIGAGDPYHGRLCPECREPISIEASRCPHCTAVLSEGENQA
jgi:large conductance mechanosensitive channel